MNGRRKKAGDRGRALDLWRAPPGAGEPLICLATTFTFDATFFETQLSGAIPADGVRAPGDRRGRLPHRA